MIQITPHVRRSSDYLDNLLRRAYFALAMLCAFGLVALPFLPIAQPGRSYAWLTLTVVTFLTAFVLMFQGRNKAPFVSGRGLTVHDPLTGLYTDTYWQDALNQRQRQRFRRPMPVTCLAIGVGGIARLRETHGQRAVDELLKRLGLELFRHVPVQDKSAREALQTFIGGKGDVMLAYENEAINAQQKEQAVDYVVPDDTILIENPIAVAAKSKKATAASAFVEFLRSEPAQRLYAERGYRPVNQAAAAGADFPEPAGLFTIKDLGGWSEVNKRFFDKEAGIVADIERQVGVSVGS